VGGYVDNKNEKGYSLPKRSVSSNFGFPANTMPPKICKKKKRASTKMPKMLMILEQ